MVSMVNKNKTYPYAYFKMDSSSNQVTDSFQFKRIIWNLLKEKKALCQHCIVKDHAYTKAGMKQHLAAAHPGIPNSSEVWQTCLTDMKKLSVQETKNMLFELSDYNKVNYHFDVFHYKLVNIKSRAYCISASLCTVK